MSTITLVQGQQAEFALPIAQGVLSAVTLTVTQGGNTVLAATAGTLQASDGVNQVYLWPATASLALGSYAYSYAWTLNGAAQTPLTGTLTVATAAQSADYTAWPTSNDVLTRLSSAGVTLRNGVASARMSTVLQDVAGEVERRTLRKFIADQNDVTRYYDGNDLPALIVDEMVSLTSVSVLTYPSPLSLVLNPDAIPTAPVPYVMADAVLVYEQGKPMTRIVAERVSTPDYHMRFPGAYGGYSGGGYLGGGYYPSTASQHRFSVGRQNVAVTGKFGYAQAIPADLWAAACGEMARRLALEASSTGDTVTQWKGGGDEAVTLTPGSIDKALAWHDQFEASVVTYTRPTASRNRLTLV